MTQFEIVFYIVILVDHINLNKFKFKFKFNPKI